MREISKEELGESVKNGEQLQKELIDAYLADINGYETELRITIKATKNHGLLKAARFISGHMILMLTEIEKETGQTITHEDTGPIPKL